MTSQLLKSRTQEVLLRIKQFSSPSFKRQMSARFGINTQFAVGTPVTVLRQLAKSLPAPDQELADSLWATSVHEARILAALLANPAQITRETLNAWANDLNSWDVCDACALHLFAKTKSPIKLAEHWIKKEKEFVRRAGFATLAVLAMPRAKTKDEDLIKLLPLIKNHACDPRPMVHKAVNWALRNIGKKNPRLTPYALKCTQEILDLYPDNRAAVWVAKNAIWELNLPKTRQQIARRK